MTSLQRTVAQNVGNSGFEVLPTFYATVLLRGPNLIGPPNASTIDTKDGSGKTTRYSTYDENGNLVHQVEGDRGVPRHGIPGATKKTPTSNILPDGTVRPGKEKILPATPQKHHQVITQEIRIMNIKSLMSIDTDLLLDYREALTLNPNNWDISEYIDWKYDMNAALAFSKLFFPDFIEKDECIILSFRFDEESFEAWRNHFKNDITAIETACNMYKISDYFRNKEIYKSDAEYYKAIREFSYALKTAWQLNCNNLFPQRNIMVDVYDDMEETKITLYTVK